VSIVQINVLTVAEGSGAQLEQRFAMRKKSVDDTPGFEGFDLLRPTAGTDKYMVVTRWADQEAFDAWRSGMAFQRSHGASEGGSPAGGDAKPADPAAQSKAHAEDRLGGQKPAATDSELWGFDVVDLDALVPDAS
jgi:heme-degrading monooxygenase HmoA